MPWTWVRPADPSLLDGRPLLDLGGGDGQTLAALVGARSGGIVGLDRNFAALQVARRPRVPLVCGEATRLPVRERVLSTVLAGDLFHHLGDEELAQVLAEVSRVLRPGGRLVAWWYERQGRPAPDAPRFPRSYGEVERCVSVIGFDQIGELALETTLEPAPATVGVVAIR